MMIIRELLTKFGFDVDNGALDKLSKQVDGVKTGLKYASAAVSAFGAAMSAVAVKTALDGDKFAKHSKRIGLTVSEYQQLDHAAQLSGTSIEEMQTGIRRLAMTIDGAERGMSTAVDTARQLGVSFRNEDGTMRGVSEVIEDIADKIAILPDGLQKTALAQAAFGRGGNAMINMLNEGGEGIRRMRAELEELGGEMDEKTAKASENFIDAQRRVFISTRGLMYAIGGELLPAMTEQTNQTIEWWKANKDLVKTRVQAWVKGIVATVKDLTASARRLFERIDPVVERMGGWELLLRRLAVAAGLFMAAFATAKLLALTKALALAAVSIFKLGLSAAPIGLTAVALLALGLAIEDVIAYSQGADSVLGRLEKRFESVKTAVDAAKLALKDLKEALGMQTPLSPDRRLVGDQQIPRVRANRSQAAVLWDGVTAGIGEFLKGPEVTGALRGAFRGVGLMPENADAAVFTPDLGLLGRLGAGPAGSGTIPIRRAETAMPPMAAPQTTITAPVTVNVTQPGATPEQVGAAVREGVREGLSTELRRAGNNLRQSEQ